MTLLAAPPLDWPWLRTVLLGYDTPPLSTHITPPSGVLLGILYLLLASSLLLLCTATLPLAPRAYPLTSLARLAAFPLILHICLHVAVSPKITLGAPLRDFVWAIVGWNIAAKALDVCVGSYFVDADDEAQRCPRWIVPAGKERSLGRGMAVPLGAGSPTGKMPSSDSHSAASGSALPAQWYAIPHAAHPLLSLRRLLWSVDHLSLLRPHTSWLLPREQRALEWAHRSLLSAATSPPPTWLWDPPLYGSAEDRCLRTALPKLGLCALLAALSQCAFVPPGSAGFYAQTPAWVQVYNVALYGGIISLLPGSLEALTFPLLRRAARLPATALMPFFRQPLAARGPADFWGRRWHAYIRRVCWRDARLFPLGSAQTHPRGNKLWAFAISGSLHGAIFARWIALPGADPARPRGEQPAYHFDDPRAWYGLAFLLVPGPMAFFVGQGVLVALDLLLQRIEAGASASASAQHEHEHEHEHQSKHEDNPPSKSPSKTRPAAAIRALRRLLLWAGIAYTGRWFAGSVAATGLHSPQGQRSMHAAELWEMARSLARGEGWW